MEHGGGDGAAGGGGLSDHDSASVTGQYQDGVFFCDVTAKPAAAGLSGRLGHLQERAEAMPTDGLAVSVSVTEAVDIANDGVFDRHVASSRLDYLHGFVVYDGVCSTVCPQLFALNCLPSTVTVCPQLFALN